jgi:hypothetical protein|tara:strand:+ start:799 stop:1008 length:210 start_codon:yes stop_codon:yes gene_type:complete
MFSTTYEVMREVVTPEGVTVTLKVFVVDEVIGVNETSKSTTINKVVVDLATNYTNADLVNAARAEGFNL